MTDPWFPGWGGGVIGGVLGTLGGTWGALVGIVGSKGKCKALVVGSTYFILGLSILLLILGIVAWMVGQPYHVWYGLGLSGMIGTSVIGINLPNVFRAYRMREERQIQAKDL